MKYSFFVFSAITFCLAGCGSKDGPKPGKADNTVKPIDHAGGINHIAKIWKNGKASALTDGTFNAEVNSVFVSGIDVYAAGFEISGTNKNSVAKLWKNGVATTLSDPASFAVATAVCINGTDVYVTGYQTQSGYKVAKLWKNGVATDLSDTQHDAIGSAVSVVDGNVYVAGYQNTSFLQFATLWKNGKVLPLELHTDRSSNAYAVYASGKDVYAAGYELYGANIIPKVWKNGARYPLSDSLQYASAYGLFVAGNDVYTAGVQANPNPTSLYTLAKYWKNGVPILLTSGTEPAVGSAIYVSGDDVYVAGHDFQGGKVTVVDPNNTVIEVASSVAKYWKNGNPVNLTDHTKDASASSIFVSGSDVYVGGYEAKTAN